jgi:serine/threonine protein phosphatase PrpC
VVTTLDIVAVTHHGLVRARNEDTVAVAGFLSGAFEGAPIRLSVDLDAPPLGLDVPSAPPRPVSMLVADGLGGHVEGFRASRLAAAMLVDQTTDMRDEETIIAALREANRAIFVEAAHNPDWFGMGTTIVGLVFHDGGAYCFNVGDSRCYHLVDGVLIQLSVDDSPALDPSLGRRFTTIVTQTLGGTRSEIEIDPHVLHRPVQPGDTFLLCSDGLTDYADLDRIEEELAGAPDDPIATAGALVRLALEGGGKDNISVILVTVGP